MLDMGYLLEILCKPGFTTQEQADLASGRGVGMDIVKNTVNELGGFMSLETQVDVKTCFTIQLPLTLAIADALIVSAGGQRFAIPRLSVQEIMKSEQKNITILENNEILSHRGNALPLLHLAQFFHLEEKSNNTFYVLVVGGTNVIGIVVDKILGEREIVVRALQDPLVQVQGISGASELGDVRKYQETWQITPEILLRVKWTTANLILPNQVTHLALANVIFCRNVFIYFSEDKIRQTVKTFFNFMRKPGYLFIGSSESLLKITADFELKEINNAFVYVKL
jgi:chemotaxis signal transduction protein